MFELLMYCFQKFVFILHARKVALSWILDFYESQIWTIWSLIPVATVWSVELSLTPANPIRTAKIRWSRWLDVTSKTTPKTTKF